MDKIKKIKPSGLKKILIIIFILLIGFIIGFSLIKESKKETLENNQDIKSKISEERKNIIKNYLNKNISELSPEKEVLGGKFYITNIEFENNENAFIEYEDGHIALKAEIKFKIKNEKIEVINFELINKNSAIITDEHMKCASHDECVPLPGCHSYNCINKKYLDNYLQPDVCTMIYDNCAAYENADCICQQGICFNENLMNADCQ